MMLMMTLESGESWMMVDDAGELSGMGGEAIARVCMVQHSIQ